MFLYIQKFWILMGLSLCCLNTEARVFTLATSRSRIKTTSTLKLFVHCIICRNIKQLPGLKKFRLPKLITFQTHGLNKKFSMGQMAQKLSLLIRNELW